MSYAIPDHPWVDGYNGAAVRIAITVGSAISGDGTLQTIQEEYPGENGEIKVDFSTKTGFIQADLRIGARISSAKALLANARICWQGCKLVGAGFQISQAESEGFARSDPRSRSLLRRYSAGSDITKRRNERFVIDTFGVSEQELLTEFPAAYQWLRDRVFPE